MIPSNDEGGLGSVVVAKGRAYLSVVWHSNVPTETRQIDDLVLRQLGFAPLDALGPDVVKQMEAARESIGPQLRGKKLDEYTEQWIAEHLDKKQKQLYGGYVADRFKKGTRAMPLDVLARLDAHKKKIFASAAEMQQWLDAENLSAEMKEQIVAAVPATRRVAEDTIVCLDLASGKTLWKTKAPGEPLGANASSTPCVFAGRVFALGSTQIYCVDAETGNQLWSERLPSKGPGSSPLAVEGLVVANAGKLVAFESESGRQRWVQEKAGGGNSSPVSWSAAGRTLVLCNGRSNLSAVDLERGEIVWTAPGGGDSTPAIVGDTLVVQTQKPELGIVAYKLGATGAEKLWNHSLDVLRNQSSPIIHADSVFLMDDDVHSCFDLATGAVRWQEKVPSTISSPVVADGKLFVMTNNGNTVQILKAAGAARTELGKAIVRAAWVPSPAIADGKLIVRLKDRVRCYDIAAR